MTLFRIIGCCVQRKCYFCGFKNYTRNVASGNFYKKKGGNNDRDYQNRNHQMASYYRS